MHTRATEESPSTARYPSRSRDSSAWDKRDKPSFRYQLDREPVSLDQSRNPRQKPYLEGKNATCFSYQELPFVKNNTIP